MITTFTYRSLMVLVITILMASQDEIQAPEQPRLLNPKSNYKAGQTIQLKMLKCFYGLYKTRHLQPSIYSLRSLELFPYCYFLYHIFDLYTKHPLREPFLLLLTDCLVNPVLVFECDVKNCVNMVTLAATNPRTLQVGMLNISIYWVARLFTRYLPVSRTI